MNRYVMGCGTSPLQQFDGIVGCHAYSILKLKSLSNISIGKQTKIYEFYKKNDILLEKIENVRLIQIRNPWGHKEWRGEWGTKSDMWTSSLSSMLGKTEANDGIFWMKFEDFLINFSVLDICKICPNYYILSFRIIYNNILLRCENINNIIFKLDINGEPLQPLQKYNINEYYDFNIYNKNIKKIEIPYELQNHVPPGVDTLLPGGGYCLGPNFVSSAFLLSVSSPSWFYISIIQPSKRSRQGRNYWYKDISLLIGRSDSKFIHKLSSVNIYWRSPERVGCHEIFLDCPTDSNNYCQMTTDSNNILLSDSKNTDLNMDKKKCTYFIQLFGFGSYEKDTSCKDVPWGLNSSYVIRFHSSQKFDMKPTKALSPAKLNRNIKNYIFDNNIKKKIINIYNNIYIEIYENIGSVFIVVVNKYKNINFNIYIGISIDIHNMKLFCQYKSSKFNINIDINDYINNNKKSILVYINKYIEYNSKSIICILASKRICTDNYNSYFIKNIKLKKVKKIENDEMSLNEYSQSIFSSSDISNNDSFDIDEEINFEKNINFQENMNTKDVKDEIMNEFENQILQHVLLASMAVNKSDQIKSDQKKSDQKKSDQIVSNYKNIKNTESITEIISLIDD
eukprot:GHVL01026402.1.p1 GENE.GHVL01026402.1~~GHVL01026402.1.p1  ORF type:complete len:623 (+),score=228.42 GHVL01026402.1:890-2758(+)